MGSPGYIILILQAPLALNLYNFTTTWISNTIQIHTNKFLHLQQEQIQVCANFFAAALLNEIILCSEVPKAEQPPAGVEQGYIQTELPTDSK
jgi:hypothetical protein